jgi:hypothetical protein
MNLPLVFLLVIMVCLLFLGLGLFIGRISGFLTSIPLSARLSPQLIAALGTVGMVVIVAFWISPELGLIALAGAAALGLLFALYWLLNLSRGRRP